MKRILGLTFTVFVLFCAGGAGTYKIMNNAKEYEKEKQERQQIVTALSLGETDETIDADALTEEQLREQERIARIHGMKYALNLPNDANQDMVIDVMHQMTHQKVRAEEKEGAIPMSEDTINQVIDVVSGSDFGLKDELLKILTRWELADFSSIDSDHNYLWNYQEGRIGKAYGRLSLAEEEEFIRLNF